MVLDTVPIAQTGITKKLAIQGLMPWVIQLYPGMHSIGGEYPEYFALHLWREIQKDAYDRPSDLKAELACRYALGEPFGTFLVLCPGGATPTKGIRDTLECRSQAWSLWDEAPSSPHTILLTPKEARRKSSFFQALTEVLCKSEPTMEDQKRQDMAATLIAKFFSGHPGKMRKLATLVSHKARFGGSFNAASED